MTFAGGETWSCHRTWYQAGDAWAGTSRGRSWAPNTGWKIRSEQAQKPRLPESSLEQWLPTEADTSPRGLSMVSTEQWFGNKRLQIPTQLLVGSPQLSAKRTHVQQGPSPAMSQMPPHVFLEGRRNKCWIRNNAEDQIYKRKKNNLSCRRK